MILVDTAIWIDHLRRPIELFSALLEEDRIHPFILGEIALGNFSNRDGLIAYLAGISTAIIAEDHEVRALINRYHLFGSGIGYVDAHLLASVRLTPAASIWTRDRRMLAAADLIGIAARLTH